MRVKIDSEKNAVFVTIPFGQDATREACLSALTRAGIHPVDKDGNPSARSFRILRLAFEPKEVSRWDALAVVRHILEQAGVIVLSEGRPHG